MVWWFSVPKVVFGDDALSDLERVIGKKAMIITDSIVHSLGYPDRVRKILEDNGWSVDMWDEAIPDPPVSVVKGAAKALTDFGPDWIIAVGGGSVMDTAKAAWILYEHPETDLAAVNPLQPLDIRQKARLICIPTTAGTGSEATKAIVIKDDATGRKFATSNEELTPDIAILDPEFVKALPKNLTAYTGLDVLTHAVEGYVSVWKNDFSDACSIKAVTMVFEWLPKSVQDLDDLLAREKMLVAANLAGMSFSNSQVALAHSLGHCMGSVYHLQHGLAVGLALPYTIEYNAAESEEAARHYWELASFIGIHDEDHVKASLQFAARIRDLQREIEAPTSIKEAGISENDFQEGLERVVEFTMMDSSITMNPRDINSERLKTFYQYMFNGKPIDF